MPWGIFGFPTVAILRARKPLIQVRLPEDETTTDGGKDGNGNGDKGDKVPDDKTTDGVRMGMGIKRMAIKTKMEMPEPLPLPSTEGRLPPVEEGSRKTSSCRIRRRQRSPKCGYRLFSRFTELSAGVGQSFGIAGKCERGSQDFLMSH